MRWWYAASGLVCLLWGCGSPNVAGGGSLPDPNLVEDIATDVFPDDADPVMASQPFVENELLVQPYPGADDAGLNALIESANARVIGELEEIGLTVLQVDAGDIDAAASQLARGGLIEGIHKNYRIETQKRPDDADLGLQTYLDRIGAPQAWDRTVGAASTLIAAVDTGVQTDHPDLVDRLVDGWNVYDNNDNFFDVFGHGTQVTGVLAATTDNAIGVAGVTWSNPVMVVRAANAAGQATSRHVAAGILWAAGHGAKVINVSFAPLWSNTVVRSAVKQAFNRGALVVISAGNGGGTTASRGYAEALFVGATDATNALAFFSDRGPFVDVVAPGTAIRSTALGGGYAPADGTSFAAPIVAGVAALAWSMNPDLRPVTIASVIMDTAEYLGVAGRDSIYGHGAVDARAAVVAAANIAFVPDHTPPTVDITRPASGAVLTRRFVASVSAEDSWGVADVSLLVDDVPQGTDTRSPYRFVMDPGRFNAGRHKLSFVATDLAGNASAAKTVFVDFSRARSTGGRVTFESPASGARVSGDVLISATVTANAGLATIEWRVDGETMLAAALSGDSSGVTYLWRTGEVSPGQHRITISITDTKGAQAIGSLTLVTR